ncbi:hypothetical protein ATY41_08600 [Leifsonia xyli subsp. xyli]|uniref:Uncharacterized protein n=1 Tax=Leifsonia xyli subsp. xyli TaxID=59736 RepID=A0A1E2SMG8_LEIXY|nr:hypothetical protein [Leifsonia xyli]ODA90824.1 hypothetical protein ATY41_08600 [Leifsonia xyli subsp. xyli]
MVSTSATDPTRFAAAYTVVVHVAGASLGTTCCVTGNPHAPSNAVLVVVVRLPPVDTGSVVTTVASPVYHAA